jgi:hypothetical protein
MPTSCWIDIFQDVKPKSNISTFTRSTKNDEEFNHITRSICSVEQLGWMCPSGAAGRGRSINGYPSTIPNRGPLRRLD